jgi:hypothetical protein
MRLNSSLKVVLLSMVSFVALISTWDGIFYPGDLRWENLLGAFLLCLLVAMAVVVPPLLVPWIIRSKRPRIHVAGILGSLMVLVGIVLYHWRAWSKESIDPDRWMHPPFWQRGVVFVLYLLAIGAVLTFLGLWDERRQATKPVNGSNPPVAPL